MTRAARAAEARGTRAARRRVGSPSDREQDLFPLEDVGVEDHHPRAAEVLGGLDGEIPALLEYRRQQAHRPDLIEAETLGDEADAVPSPQVQRLLEGDRLQVLQAPQDRAQHPLALQ